MAFAGGVLCCCKFTVVGVEWHPVQHHDPCDPEQLVGEAAQGTTAGVTAPAQAGLSHLE